MPCIISTKLFFESLLVGPFRIIFSLITALGSSSSLERKFSIRLRDIQASILDDITIGKAPNGNPSKLNKDKATKAMSLVNGLEDVKIKTVNVDKATREGIAEKVKL